MQDFGEEFETEFDTKLYCPNCKSIGILEAEIRDEKFISTVRDLADPEDKRHLMDPISTDADYLLSLAYGKHPGAVVRVYKLCTDERILNVLEEFVLDAFTQEIPGEFD